MHRPGHVGGAEVYQADVLLPGEGGALPGGAADAQGVHPGLQLAVDLPAEGGVIHGAPRLEGGDEGGAGAGKDGCFHKNSFPDATGQKKDSPDRLLQTSLAEARSGLCLIWKPQRGRM